MLRMYTRRNASTLWTLFIAFSQLALGVYAGKCLQNIPEVNPKKYLNFEQQSLNITIQVSSRITHQLTSHMLKIVLQEVVGYPNVEIYHLEDDFNVDGVINELSGPLNDTTQIIPKVMINLEVWVPPDNPTLLLRLRYVKDCGTLAPPGRFGWFIPKTLAEPLKELYNTSNLDALDVHWTLFKDPNLTKKFDITDMDAQKLIGHHSIDSINEDSCSEESCSKGMYIPKWCGVPHKGEYVPCAMLLTSDYNITKFVIDHIKELHLYVKVVWLGPNLKFVADQLQEIYRSKAINKSIVILSWYPSGVILQGDKFISVTFKHCNFADNSTVGCKYEMMRPMKYSWSRLEKQASDAFKLVEQFRFSEEQYVGLLQMYDESEDKSPVDVACNWLVQNQNTWKKEWLIFEPRKHNIYIGGIFPMTQSSYSGAGILASAKMAIEAINANDTLLSNCTLKLLLNDGKCSADYVLKAFIDYIKYNFYDNLIGVLGPACSETVEPLAGVSKHYNSIVISYSAEGASFSDRTKYPYFFRTIGENHMYKYVYLKLLKDLKWKRVSALTEDGQKYTEYISHMSDLLKSNGIQFISNKKFPRERSTHAMRSYLEDLKIENARIIIADVFDEVARSVMCEAYKLNMTANEGYVWFLPSWLNKTWYNTTHFHEVYKEDVNCTTEQMIKAINGHLSMTNAYFAEDNVVMQENITVAEWRENYKKRCQRMRPVPAPSDYAGFAYDAVWTYALALEKLAKQSPEAITDLHSQKTTNKLVKLIENTDFMGVSGQIKFHGGPSRISSINVMQWYDNKFHIVGHYVPDVTKPLTGNLTWIAPIKWLTKGQKQPDDGTIPPAVCALDGLSKLLNVSCDHAIIILNVVVFSILIAVVTSGLYIMKKRYDNKMKKTMHTLGLDLIYPLNGDLDKWEIPRETVVINRKLGEGAFGTVYGGEANFSDRGWLAVAVKTLKVGSSTNEKLDFLSEAEVMKRFDHKNVVKLLGVCTKTEPVYTVMEFMLYGDLKTYLLARRHLVNNNHNDEAEEVSSKRLTSIALDVARGLSYLAELKYVHRDIASRNCLINAQRVVKIGDFGMTRPMLENDYYRFHRKGMLPVRWMAPESLALGLFTPASDVWSYGVLLYEIVTFGSFPFQGLSNSQVLDYVKAGNTLNIPVGVKLQLEGLLKSCWQQEGKSRPQASEIVEFLANNPRLISPCLDIPLSSVQMEDTGQLEMHLPQPFRKCSSSLSFKNLPVPNGLTSTPSPTARSHVPQDSGVYLQLDNCCPREPLLGPPLRSNSLLGITKYVTIQPNHFDSGCEQDESEDNYRPNGNAITKV